MQSNTEFKAGQQFIITKVLEIKQVNFDANIVALGPEGVYDKEKWVEVPINRVKPVSPNDTLQTIKMECNTTLAIYNPAFKAGQKFIIIRPMKIKQINFNTDTVILELKLALDGEDQWWEYYKGTPQLEVPVDWTELAEAKTTEGDR